MPGERPDAPVRPVRGARRRLLALPLAIALPGCAALAPPGGQPVESATRLPVGTVLRYATRDGYRGALLEEARWIVDAAGARFENLAYEEAGSGGFGESLAPMVARLHDPSGALIAWERADGTRTRFDPPLRALPFPLVPGATLRQDVIALTGSRARAVVMRLRVGGWERIAVPAGIFDALRVDRDLWLGDHDFHRTETRRIETDWYAPEIGALVRCSEDSAHQDLLAGRPRFGPALIRRGDWRVRELLERPPISPPPPSPRNP
jgi:hypothetical protein